jgi:FkbM family methyltransferase
MFWILNMKKVIKQVLPNTVLEFVRVTKVWINDQVFKPRWIKRNFLGYELKVLISDPTAFEWYEKDNDLWEQWEALEKLQMRSLKPGSVVFDIGAHQAVVASILARQVSPGGKIIALEPVPRNVKVGQENVKANQLDNVVLIEAAISATSGNLTFSQNYNGQVTNSGEGITVNSISIDELSQQYGKPDVIVLDVEGYEYEALKGAKATIASGVDFFIEIHSYEDHLSKFGASAEKVLSVFPKENYELLIGQPYDNFVPLNDSLKVTIESKQPFNLLALSK